MFILKKFYVVFFYSSKPPKIYIYWSITVYEKSFIFNYEISISSESISKFSQDSPAIS